METPEREDGYGENFCFSGFDFISFLLISLLSTVCFLYALFKKDPGDLTY
jgi:hypothetical protein